MGYSVYWANGRWQGYGVPAYCDYPGCQEVINRGMGYQHPDDGGDLIPRVFVCNEHRYKDIESFDIKRKEHQDWIDHVKTDDSWKQWREENQEAMKAMESK